MSTRSSKLHSSSGYEMEKNNLKWSQLFSEACLEVVFLMTRFREHLKLPEFTHIEFEEELLKEDDNFLATESEVYRSLLFSQILNGLLQISDNSKKNLAQTKIVSFAKAHFDKNPFGDSDSYDFHLLPTNVKLWVLQKIVVYYCEQGHAQNVDTWRNANELRVKTFSLCSNKDEMYYFHDLRLFKKHTSSIFKNRTPTLDATIVDSAAWKDMYYEVLRGNQYECIANSEDTWSSVIKKLEKNKNSTDKNVAEELKAVFASIKDDFQELLNRYNSQKSARSKITQKLDIEIRRSMGLTRSSARLRYRKSLNVAKDDGDESDSEEKTNHKGTNGTSIDEESKKMSRAERFLRREELKYSSYSNVDWEKVNDASNNSITLEKKSNGKDNQDALENSKTLSEKNSSDTVEAFELKNCETNLESLDEMGQKRLNDSLKIVEEQKIAADLIANYESNIEEKEQVNQEKIISFMEIESARMSDGFEEIEETGNFKKSASNHDSLETPNELENTEKTVVGDKPSYNSQTAEPTETIKNQPIMPDSLTTNTIKTLENSAKVVETSGIISNSNYIEREEEVHGDTNEVGQSSSSGSDSLSWNQKSNCTDTETTSRCKPFSEFMAQKYAKPFRIGPVINAQGIPNITHRLAPSSPVVRPPPLVPNTRISAAAAAKASAAIRFPRLNVQSVGPKRKRATTSTKRSKKSSSSSQQPSTSSDQPKSTSSHSASPKKRVKFDLDSVQKEEEEKILQKQKNQEASGIEKTDEMQHGDKVEDKEKQEEQEDPAQTRIINIRTAIRLFGERYSTLFETWSAHYNIQVIPKELEVFFSFLPEDDSLVTMAEWAQIKSSIFRTPMRIGGVEGLNFVDKGRPYRELALSMLRFNVAAWPLIYHEVSEEDSGYIQKSNECIQKLLPYEKKDEEEDKKMMEENNYFESGKQEGENEEKEEEKEEEEEVKRNEEEEDNGKIEEESFLTKME